MSDPNEEETPAQRRLRLGKSGQVGAQLNRTRNRGRPPPLFATTTRPTEEEINKGNTPPPSPVTAKQPGAGQTTFLKNKGDEKEVPLLEVPGAGGRVVTGGLEAFGAPVGRFGAGFGGAGGGFALSAGFERQKAAFGLGQIVTPKEENFKRPGIRLGGPAAGSPGIQVRGAATFGGASGGGLGFGGVKESPWSGGEVKVGVKRGAEGELKPPSVTAGYQQNFGSPISRATQPQQTAPPAAPWGGRSAGFREKQQNFASGTGFPTRPPSTSWTATSASNNNTTQENSLSGKGFDNSVSSTAFGARSGKSGGLNPTAAPFSTTQAGFSPAPTTTQQPTEFSASGNNNNPGQTAQSGSDDQQRYQDEDIDLLDAVYDTDEDLDTLDEGLGSGFEDPQKTVNPPYAPQRQSTFSQAPAPANLTPQDVIYEPFKKKRELEQREAELKEQARQKLQARQKPVEPPSMPPQIQPGTPFLGQFLNAINGYIKADNEALITDYLVIEPPYSEMYNKMIAELRQHFMKGAEDALEDKCRQLLSHAREGVDGSPSWSQFIRLMVQYLSFVRDVDMDQSKYLETYESLTELQKKANSALSHAQLGHLVLGTVISGAKAMCRLAIGLEKNPHLIAHLKSANMEESTTENEARTLPERTVEILRTALSNCVTDRSSKVARDGKIEGKQRGAYALANICLKIYFQCRSTRNATLVFQSIGSTTIPISAYSKRERITYLYYLGRFNFQNNHFERARRALIQAYNECSVHDHSIRQRRYILVFLIASSLIVGRFPNQAIFQRPEAQGLQERFLPLMQAMRFGDLALFKQHMSLDSPHADWFLHFRILLQLKNRCEVFVSRSLIRKVWILNGSRFDAANPSKAVTVDLNDIIAALSALEKQSRSLEDAAYIDNDLDGAEDHVDEERLPDVRQVESIIGSLVDQGLLKGFIAHRPMKFCITGVRNSGGDVLAAGFPQPWRVLEQKINQDEGNAENPGWKTGAPGSMATGGAMGGKVINMSGLRQVGTSS